MKLNTAIKQALESSQSPFLIGIEREGLRVTRTGNLAETPHPPVFGEKLKNYHIKTDFCESQPELVTSPQPSAKDAYRELSKLTTTLKEQIFINQELFWPQSMPCILPSEERILTAVHPGTFAAPMREYLEKVRVKYGARNQSICGIHYNISLGDDFWKTLQHILGDGSPLRDFKDRFYLKMLRNYQRYSWLMLLLTGCSPAVHESFGVAIPGLEKDERGFFTGKTALTLRYSRIGYRNKKEIKVDYSSVETLCKSLEAGVEEGLLIDQGELFATAKVKARDNVNPAASLRKDGILYLELRNIDLNIFDDCGISEADMEFIPLLILYLMTVPEMEFGEWQQEAEENSQLVAEQGRRPDLQLKHMGEKKKLSDWVEEMVVGIRELNREAQICKEHVLERTIQRLLNPEESYAARNYDVIMENGYIEGNMKR